MLSSYGTMLSFNLAEINAAKKKAFASGEQG